MRRRFLVEAFEDGGAVVRGPGAHHLGRVLRARPGQLYELSDGRGVWLGKVAGVSRDGVRFVLIEPLAAATLPVQAGILLSIVRFARLEWCLEKATEMGAAWIQPLAAARSDPALLLASGKRKARWERILREASEQARRSSAPRLAASARATDAFRDAKAETKILLSERREAPPLRSMVPAAPGGAVVLAFGPEGGWTDVELEAALAAGFAEASLGPLVLRTETAVVAAMALVLLGWPPDEFRSSASGAIENRQGGA